jgi:hypothetical protein
MASVPSFSGLAWDACALLNLAATGRAEDILPVFGCPSYVVRQVRIGGVFYLRSLPEDDPSGALVTVDLTPLLVCGLLVEVELNDAEQESFVALATQLDDGEARTAALAVHRGLCVVTDDRPTLRVLAELSPPVPTMTTPEWVKHWADAGAISSVTLSEVLRRIEVGAHFFPRRLHRLKGWWDSQLPRPPEER